MSYQKTKQNTKKPNSRNEKKWKTLRDNIAEISLRSRINRNIWKTGHKVGESQSRRPVMKKKKKVHKETIVLKRKC